MKIVLALSVSSLAMLLGGAVQAADVYGSIKDTGVSEAPAEMNWSGVYIGGAVGYGNANHDLSLQKYHGTYCFDKHGDDDVGTQPTDSFEPHGGSKSPLNADGTCDTKEGEVQVDAATKGVANLDGVNSHGIVGDVRLGYDAQLGQRVVIGVYGAYGFSGMETSANIGDLSAGIEKGDEWTLGARAGLLVNPRTLAYVLAAYSQTDYDFSISDGVDSASKTVEFDGVTIGAGIEFALTRNIFLGIEGTHTFYGSEVLFDSGTEEGCTVCRGTRLTDDLDETKVMGTVKVKLNGGMFSN